MAGELLIRWTARLAVACYLARLMIDATGNDATHLRKARAWWTAGFVWFVLHVFAAYHFEHGWSRAVAYQATAKRTAEMTGWDSGFGLYVNEAFLCLWLLDVALWWTNLAWPTNRSAYWMIQGVFAFMMVQATAIFGPSFWKPVAAAAVIGLLFFVVRSSRIRRGTSAQKQHPSQVSHDSAAD